MIPHFYTAFRAMSAMFLIFERSFDREGWLAFTLAVVRVVVL